MSGRSSSVPATLSQNGAAAVRPAVRGGALDLLRFLAAFFVVLYHYGSEAPIEIYDIHAAFDRGYLATDFFLILSGFVLGRAYGAQIEKQAIGPTAFLLKRLFRIWPAHLIVLGATVALVTAAGVAGFQPHHSGRFESADLLPQAFLIQAWGDFGGGGWNLPTWSLSALLLCYAAFAPVWKGFSKVAPLVAVMAAGSLVFAMHVFSWERIGQGLFDLPYQFGVLRALPLFILGAALARFAQGAPTPRGHALIAGFSSLGALVLLQLAGRFDALSVTAIAVMIAAFGSMAVDKPSPALAYGGRISFALFITHVPAAIVWFGVMHVVELSPAAHWAAWAGSFVFALAVSGLFERFVDKPVQAVVTPALKAALAWRPFAKPQAA